MNIVASTRRLVDRLCLHGGVRVTETPTTFRVTNLNAVDEHLLALLRELDGALRACSLDDVQLHGGISDTVDLANVTASELKNEPLSVLINKTVEPGWCYFLTLAGFEQSLRKGQVGSGCQCIWVLAEFAPFATYAFTVKPVGTDKAHEAALTKLERPLKLVRDLSKAVTPDQLDSWLLMTRPGAGSEVFSAWQAVAKEKLAFCLAMEIRSDEGQLFALFKGGRSYPIPIETHPVWAAVEFESLHGACEWVYSTPKESETKFLLLNSHLSMNWIDGELWPAGAKRCLENSVAGAREAFAFHLHDQSKETIKNLVDLRKGLQDEVNKVQASTKDLVSAIWRDFAVAGVVLALKTPMLSVIASENALKVLSVGTAFLLLFSLLVTFYSNASFNRIADRARNAWRSKLYAFMSDSDWAMLVDRPIAKGRTVYGLSLAVSTSLYLCIIGYLLWVGAPDWMETHLLQPLRFLQQFAHSC